MIFISQCCACTAAMHYANINRLTKERALKFVATSTGATHMKHKPMSSIVSDKTTVVKISEVFFPECTKSSLTPFFPPSSVDPHARLALILLATLSIALCAFAVPVCKIDPFFPISPPTALITFGISCLSKSSSWLSVRLSKGGNRQKSSHCFRHVANSPTSGMSPLDSLYSTDTSSKILSRFAINASCARFLPMRGTLRFKCPKMQTCTLTILILLTI
mmetsp:Transcript_219/g.554  ORF Transcript_219/g.554 Transcript_219/m.554 type:complete len:219 (+) Transcript_219:1766-2422(+)